MPCGREGEGLHLPPVPEALNRPYPNELTDSIEDLARESGAQLVKLQQELAARQAAMKQYRDSASKDDGQTAVASAEQYKTLAQQLATWRSLRNRRQLIAQAEQLARADMAALTADDINKFGPRARTQTLPIDSRAYPVPLSSTTEHGFRVHGSVRVCLVRSSFTCIVGAKMLTDG